MTHIIFMNIRDLGADHKFLAPKDLFLSYQSNIILIQETMHAAIVSIRYFRRMFPSWHIVATYANRGGGVGGGLVIFWNPLSISAKAFKCFAKFS